MPKLKRTPGDEEILRLAEAPDDPAVRSALTALTTSTDGLEALLRQKTRFDARSLAPLLAESARDSPAKRSGPRACVSYPPST